MRYWHVAGRLGHDNSFTLRPGWLDHRPRRPASFDSPFEVELLGADGALRLRHPLALRSSCSEGRGPPEPYQSVRAWVPFPDGVASIRFVNDGAVVHEMDAREEVPELILLSPPPRRGRGRYRLRWRASHPADRTLEFFCRYSNDGGRRWFRLGFRTGDTTAEIDLDDLPGGEACLLAVVATDGLSTAVARTRPFEVARKPFDVRILEPSAGCRAPAGEPLRLVGQAYDPDGRRPVFEGLRWSSSRDGDLGEGTSIVTPALSSGDHVIRLVVGEGERCAGASLKLRCETQGRKPAA